MKPDLRLNLQKTPVQHTEMLRFDGAAMYGTIPTWTSTSGNWTAEIVYQDTGDSGDYIIDSDDSSDSPYFILNTGGGSNTYLMNAAVMSAKVDGVSVTTGDVCHQDNALHTLELTGISQVKVGNLGCRYDQTGLKNGIIKSVKLTDLDTPSNSRYYNLNLANDLYQLPSGETLGIEQIESPDLSDISGYNVANGASTITYGKINLYSSDGSWTNVTTVKTYDKDLTYLVEVGIARVGSGQCKIAMIGSNIAVNIPSLIGKHFAVVQSDSAINYGFSIGRVSGVTDIDIDYFSVRQLNNALIYQNVSASAWDRYYFDRSLGSNGAWVSKTELVTNGGFDTDSDWNKSSSTISNGVATLTVTGGAMAYVSNIGLTLYKGKTYLIIIDATRLAGSGELTYSEGGVTNVVGETVTNGSGRWIGLLTPVIDLIDFGIKRKTTSGDYSWKIGRVSVREIIYV